MFSLIKGFAVNWVENWSWMIVFLLLLLFRFCCLILIALALNPVSGRRYELCCSSYFCAALRTLPAVLLLVLGMTLNCIRSDSAVYPISSRHCKICRSSYFCATLRNLPTVIFTRRYLNLLFRFLHGGTNSAVHHSSSLRYEICRWCFLLTSTKAEINHISAKPSTIFLRDAANFAVHHISVPRNEICGLLHLCVGLRNLPVIFAPLYESCRSL